MCQPITSSIFLECFGSRKTLQQKMCFGGSKRRECEEKGKGCLTFLLITSTPFFSLSCKLENKMNCQYARVNCLPFYFSAVETFNVYFFSSLVS